MARPRRAGGRCAEGGRHYRRLSAAAAARTLPSPRQAARGRGHPRRRNLLQPWNCDMTGQNTPAANSAMQRYWNEIAGPRWVARQAAQEARNVEMLEQLLAAAAPQPGERVLDIGVGTGVTTLPYARAVGPSGHVTGAHI